MIGRVRNAKPKRPWLRPMVPRRGDEPNRSSTPLELFFDLCFVGAVAQAAGRLHHGLAEGQVRHAVLGYLTVFFAIWWAWMNFTWFASAYDTDDDAYRLTTLLQIFGALVLAAGVPRAFDRTDFSVITWGYVIMRLALLSQWLRAARADPTRRRTDRRYAVGVTLVQVAWVARLALPDELFLPGFLVLAAADVLVPLWAERPRVTSWHREHIADRYGLFTLIVLGDSVLAATNAVQSALDEHKSLGGLLALAAGGLVTVFGMWWLYFDEPAHEMLGSVRQAFSWGYGHYLVFAAVAAVGAGLAVAVDAQARGHSGAGHPVASYAVAVPVAGYLVALWLLQARRQRPRPVAAGYPLAAVLVLLAPFGPGRAPAAAVLWIALVVAALVAAGTATSRRRWSSPP